VLATSPVSPLTGSRRSWSTSAEHDLRPEIRVARAVLPGVEDLFWKLDPAQLSESRSEVPNEYREASRGLAQRLAAESSVDEATKWLVNEFRQNWGAEILFCSARDTVLRASELVENQRSLPKPTWPTRGATG
jgi:hypothetical protein